MATWLEQLGTPGAGFLAVAGLLLGALAIGTLALRAARAHPGHPFDGGIVAVVLGLDALALVGLGVGLVGWPPVWLTRALLLGGGLAGLGLLAAGLRNAPAARARLRDPVGWLVALALVVPGLGAAACPPTGWDDLCYHVEVPSRWLAEGRLAVFADNAYSAFPSGFEILAVPALQVGGTTAPGALAFAFWSLTALGLYRLLRRTLSRLAALGVVVAIVWSPLGLMLATDAYVESLLGAHLVALLLLRPGAWQRGPGRSVVGGLLGSAAAVKLTAFALVPLLPLLAPRVGIPLRKLAWPAALAGLVATPFFLRPALATGNPFYPYFARLITPGDGVARLVSEYHHALASEPYGLSAWHAPLSTPFALAFEGHLFSGNLGWQWLALLALALLAVIRREAWPARRPAAAALALFAAWFVTAQQARFLWPAILLVSLVAARGLSGLRPGARRLLVPIGLILLTLASTPAARWRNAWSHHQLWLGIGAAPSLADYVYTGTGPGYLPAAEALLQLTPPSARVLLVAEHRGLYLPREHRIGTPFVQGRYFTPPDELDEQGVAAELAASGITHVLLGSPPRDPDVLARYRSGQRRLGELILALEASGRAEPTWSGEGYRLLRLVDDRRDSSSARPASGAATKAGKEPRTGSEP